jgi:hypothetical protein
MHLRSMLPRVLALASLFAFALPPARAQVPCGPSYLAADLIHASVSAGGVQTLVAHVSPAEAELQWILTGTMSGVHPGHPYFAQGGLYINFDRYTWRMMNGQSGLVHGGSPDTYGVVIPFDANGRGTLQVVIPPGVLSGLVGRTLHHGYFRQGVLTQLPSCGSNTVPLILVP